MIRRFLGLVAAGATAVVFAPTIVISTANAQGEGLEEVIVTARKRAESLQEIPLSISAFTADDIREGGFQDLGDITVQTAGIQYDPRAVFGQQGRANGNIVIRGAQINSALPHLQTTSLFVDGVYALGGVNSMPLNDLERVEIIKGPQSAFFGRNTFAGAVNYITKNPNLEEWETDLDVSIGQYEQNDISVVTSGPIIEDQLGFLLGARRFNRGGMYTATDGGELGEERTDSLSAVLYWEPTERLSVKLRGLYLKDDDGAPPVAILRGSDFDSCTGRNLGTRFSSNGTPFELDFSNGRLEEPMDGSGGPPLSTGAPVNYICGKPPSIGSPLVTISQETRPINPIFSQIFGVLDTTQSPPLFTPGPNPNLLREQLLNQTYLPGVPFMDRFGLERTNRRVSLSVDYEFANEWSLAFLAGQNDQDLNIVRDFDRTDVSSWYSADPQTLDDESLELRLVSGQDQRLRWLVGATWYEQEFLTSGGGGFLVTSQFLPLTSGIFSLPATSGDKAEVTGIFGALSFDLTEQLTLDVEVRTMEDERTVSSGGQELAETYDSTVPRVILSWQPNDTTNIYGQYSQGTLPGRVTGLVAICDDRPFGTPYPDPLNPGQLITLSECDQLFRQGAVPSTETQELDAIEIGIKKGLWNNRVNLTAAAYWWEWKAKPSSISVQYVRDDGSDPNSPTPNAFPNSLGATVAGNSDIFGIDLEGTLLITENWSVSTAVSFKETEFTEFSQGSLVSLIGTRNQKGNEEPNVPEFEGSLSTTFGGSLNATWDWFGRVDFIYRGEYYGDYANLIEAPDYSLTNLRFGAEKDNLRLEFFVRNLFDEDTWKQVGRAVDFTPQPANFSFNDFQGVALTPQDKRTAGVRASISF